MATIDGVPPGLAGLKAVRLGDVESELAHRVENASRAGKSLSRACALNLVVYVENSAEAQTVAALVERIADAHPIRAVQMMLDPRAPESEVRAWVNLECGDEIAGTLLCSEQIALVAHPEGAPRLVSAVNALLGADLPVALWWRGGSPFLSRIFKGVAPLADKIVVDS